MPAKMKAEAADAEPEVEEGTDKEGERLEDFVKFDDAWPLLPPLDPRQALAFDAEDAGPEVVAAAAIGAAPVMQRQVGQPKGSRNLTRTPLVEPPTTSGPEFGHLSIKTLQMRRE